MRKLQKFFGGKLFPCVLLCILCALLICAAAIRLPRALAPIAIAERLFALAAALFLAASRDTPECKISKFILLVLLPWVGTLLCFLLRRKPCRRAAAGRRAQDGTIGYLAALGDADAEVLYATDAEYFPVGGEMKRKLLSDLSDARKCIFLEYYIVEQGGFFGDVFPILRDKAKEGLDVRLIYDGFGCSLTLPRRFPKEMERAGIRVAIARPLRFPPSDLNRRNHRKIAVIDGEIGYVGGINLADEYTGEKIRFGHWKDSALRVSGTPAMRLARMIAEETGIPLPPLPEPQSGEIPCAAISDCAADTEPRKGAAAIGAMISRAERFAYCNTPYLAPDAVLLAELKRAAAAGTDVRIMIPHIPDKKTTFLLSRAFARELIRAGVQVREYTAGFLHAKSIVTDGRYSFVSSYNLDYRSLYLQAECGLAVDDEPLARALTEDFLACWEAGTPVGRAKKKKKILLVFVRPFAPLM